LIKSELPVADQTDAHAGLTRRASRDGEIFAFSVLEQFWHGAWNGEKEIKDPRKHTGRNVQTVPVARNEYAETNWFWRRACAYPPGWDEHGAKMVRRSACGPRNARDHADPANISR